MRICVVDALARSTGSRYTTFDVVGAGPRVVAGLAEKYGEVHFYTYEKALKSINDVSSKDLVLISAMSSDYVALKKLVLKLRARGFAGKIIVGGPISFEYHRILLELPVNYVVVGEAEIPLDRLLSILASGHGDVRGAPALAFSEGGLVKLTTRHIHTPVELLNTIKPWTRVREAFEYPQIYRFYVEVVRGCSNFQRPRIFTENYKCIGCDKCISSRLQDRLSCPAGIPPGCGFCSVPYLFGPPRSRDPRAIKTEIEELVQHGARRIVLSAPDFLDYMRERLVKEPLTDPCNPPPNKDGIEALLNEIWSIEEVKRGEVVIMIENIKACLVDEEVGKILGKYLKGTTVHIGLETGCDWFNEKILGKPIHLEHVVKASKILVENGLRPYVYLMYGLPFATREVYEETEKAIKTLSSIGVEKITLYKYMPLPATAFEHLKPDIETHRDLIRRIKVLTERYNTALKRKLLGSKIEVWLFKSGNRVYGYPVKHGPVVFVENPPRGKLSGCKGVVKVVDIEARYVRGVLISILECLETAHSG
jgi:radical SAM superfamily enzyme YgiQ (UPF0313 family)